MARKKTPPPAYPDWRPGRTAPRDGTAFLACMPGPSMDIVWWDKADRHFRDYYHRQRIGYLLYWTPLPAAPDMDNWEADMADQATFGHAADASHPDTDTDTDTGPHPMTREEAQALLDAAPYDREQRRCGLLRGLNFLAALTGDEDLEPCADHDIIWVCEFDETVAKMTPEQVTQMGLWGWGCDDDLGRWALNV